MKLSYKAVAVATLPLMLAACGGDETNVTSEVNYHNAKTTLSGVVRNAETNGVISDKSLEVKFFQGTSVRKAKLSRDEGYYSVNEIPTNFNNTNQYRISVNAEGYLPFEGVVSFTGTQSDYNEKIQDKEFFNVGNINLYPVGTTAADYKVTVTYDGKRVPNTEVIAELNSVTPFVQNSQATLITVALDDVTRITTTTDENGVATFAGSDLVLGGRYDLTVKPTSFNGVTVFDAGSVRFNVGTSQLATRLPLSKLTNGTDEGLYVVKTSNENTNAEGNGTGVLTITLSQDVTVYKADKITISRVAGFKADGITVGGTELVPTAESPVTVTASGNTITLTPKFKTPPEAGDTGVTVTYANLKVQLAGVDKVFDVFSLTAPSGLTLSGTVKVTNDN